MSFLKKIPFFLLLLPVFFCLHGVVENYGLITLSEVLLIGLYICMALALFFLVLWLLTKSIAIAALVTFYTGVLYLFFGALQDWLQDKPWLSFLNRYIILLPALLISIICLFYFLKRKKLFRQRLFLYMNVLLIAYSALDVVLLMRLAFINTKSNASQISFDNKRVKATPNVYYLLFDGYPGYASLQSAFGFKNDSLYVFLQNKGFTILPAIANYNYTIFSMSSILNMQYVQDNYDHQLVGQQDFKNRFNEIKNAAVFSIYKTMGYQVNNYSIFDIGNQVCVNTEISFMPVHTKVLTAKLLHKRLTRHIGWWFNKTKLEDVFKFKEPMFLADKTNQYINSMIVESLANKNGKPQFCYAHLLMPHPPYFRDSAGALVRMENNPGKSLNDTSLFLPYLKYNNSVIRLLVNKILLADPVAIIVVMSDHGFRNYESQKVYDAAVFNNICAVRLPDNTILPFDNSKSGVNFFRYLLNSAYGQHIPYLKDSSVWINH